MQIDGLKRFFMAGFLLIILLPAYSQNRLVSFEKELQTLETYKNTLGVSSIEYADQLANMAIVFQDTTYHDYYNQLSKIIAANHWTVRDHFGMDSEVYRYLLNYLSHTYTFGRFFNSVNLDYKPLVRQLLLSLEDKVDDVLYNKHEFYSLISNIYQEDKEYKNVIKWRKRAIEKIGKTNTINEYFYDNEFLAGAYYHTKQIKSFQKTASILFTDEDISDELKQMAFSYLLGQITLSKDQEWDEESARFLLNQYMGIKGLDLNKESLVYIIPAKNGDLKFLKLLEEVIVENGKMSLEEQFTYYYNVSMFLSLDAKDLKNSIVYCHRAMEVMEKIGTCESKIAENGMPYYEIMGFKYYQDKQYLKAIEYYIKGLEDLENCCSIENEEYYSLARTISSYYDLYVSDYNNSLIYSKKALLSAEKLFKKTSSQYIEVAYGIIADLRILNRFDQAKELCDSCISIIKNDSKLEKHLSSIYNQRAIIAGNQKDIHDAIKYYNLAIEYSNSINDKITMVLNRERTMNDFGYNVENTINELDSVINSTPDVSRKSKFDFYFTIANMYSVSDKSKANLFYDKAELYLEEVLPRRMISFRLSQSQSEQNSAKRYSQLLDAINIFDNNHLKDSILLAQVYTIMADYYCDVSDSPDAIDTYQKALDIYFRIKVDNTHSGFLACLNNYGVLLSHVNADKEKVIDIQTLVYDIRKGFLDWGSPELRTSAMNLITTYLENGYVDKADSIFNADRMILLGGTDEDIYTYGLMYAKIQFKKGEVEKALKEMSCLEKYLEKTPNYIIPHFETLLNFKRAAGHDLFDTWVKLMELYRQDTYSQLLYLSNSERKSLLSDFQYTTNIVIGDYKNDPRYYPLIADYSLFSKGLLLTTNQLTQKLLRKDKVAQQLLRDGKSKRIRRKSLLPSDSIQIANLDREINLIDKQLSERVETKDLIKQFSFSSSDLFKLLGKDQMAIDFIMTASDSISHYYAMIYKGNSVDFIPLFSMSDIVKYEGMGEAGINAMTKPLFGKLIWAKILPYIKESKEVFFSPVGSLNNFAIELLPILNDSVPGVSFHRVLRLEKEMFGRTKKKASTKEVAAFGDIDYETFINESKDRGMRAWKWGQLKATAEELQDIQNAYSKSHLGFYEKTDATESNFKSLDNKEVNLLHLATHGFYISDKDIELSEKGLNGNHYLKQVSASGGQGRGGLLLSGANYSWNHEVPDSIEDGILSTEEIEDLSFNNLDLVVLSACETGLGESNTDGVWGLQRAFRIAGARRQVVSLLKVDDERTKEFMGELHRNISETQDVYVSYRKAQRYMYNKYKQHPRFWASFILLE